MKKLAIVLTMIASPAFANDLCKDAEEVARELVAARAAGVERLEAALLADGDKLKEILIPEVYGFGAVKSEGLVLRRVRNACENVSK